MAPPAASLMANMTFDREQHRGRAKSLPPEPPALLRPLEDRGTTLPRQLEDQAGISGLIDDLFRSCRRTEHHRMSLPPPLLLQPQPPLACPPTTILAAAPPIIPEAPRLQTWPPSQEAATQPPSPLLMPASEAPAAEAAMDAREDAREDAGGAEKHSEAVRGNQVHPEDAREDALQEACQEPSVKPSAEEAAEAAMDAPPQWAHCSERLAEAHATIEMTYTTRHKAEASRQTLREVVRRARASSERTESVLEAMTATLARAQEQVGAATAAARVMAAAAVVPLGPPEPPPAATEVLPMAPTSPLCRRRPSTTAPRLRPLLATTVRPGLPQPAGQPSWHARGAAARELVGGSPRRAPSSPSSVVPDTVLPAKMAPPEPEETEGASQRLVGHALAPGSYDIEGVNVDVTHHHEYFTTGRFTLHTDGTLEGCASETSLVWQGSACDYLVTHGRWAPSGQLFFHLEHADHRAAFFDPFVFSIELRAALPQALEEDVPLAWMAVAGWWKTHDGTACPPPRQGLRLHAQAEERALFREMREPTGSYGRLKCWSLKLKRTWSCSL